MAKTQNKKGKMSHGGNKKPIDPEILKLWQRKVAEKKKNEAESSAN